MARMGSVTAAKAPTLHQPPLGIHMAVQARNWGLTTAALRASGPRGSLPAGPQLRVATGMPQYT